jgi:hypothetical protein
MMAWVFVVIWPLKLTRFQLRLTEFEFMMGEKGQREPGHVTTSAMYTSTTLKVTVELVVT